MRRKEIAGNDIMEEVMHRLNILPGKFQGIAVHINLHACLHGAGDNNTVIRVNLFIGADFTQINQVYHGKVIMLFRQVSRIIAALKNAVLLQPACKFHILINTF